MWTSLTLNFIKVQFTTFFLKINNYVEWIPACQATPVGEASRCFNSGVVEQKLQSGLVAISRRPVRLHQRSQRHVERTAQAPAAPHKEGVWAQRRHLGDAVWWRQRRRRRHDVNYIVRFATRSRLTCHKMFIASCTPANYSVGYVIIPTAHTYMRTIRGCWCSD